MSGSGSSTIVALVSGNGWGASVWSDYNAAVTFPVSSFGSTSSERYSIGSAYSTAGLIAGGNTYSQAYVHQYKVTFYKSGVGTVFTGTVLTVDSINYTVAGFPSPFWWNAASSHIFSFASPLVVNSTVSYTWSSTGGLSTQQSETLMISASGVIDGNYFATNSVTFSITRVSSDFTGTVVIIDGVSYTASQSPISFAWVIGSVHSFAFQSPLVVTSNGKRYVWDYNEGLSGLQSDSINITASGPIEGYYKTQYYLSVNAGGHGIAGGAGWYDAGVTAYATMSPLTVTGAVGTQYVFAGWTGDVSGSGSPSSGIVMGAAKTVTAIWKIQYYLTVNNGGHGTASDQIWYDAGTSQLFSISPTTVSGGAGIQYVFTGWDGSGLYTDASDPVTMNNAITETAQWKTQYQVSFAVSPSGSGSTSPSGVNVWYDSGSLSISATPNSGYSFSFWSSNTGSITFASATSTFTTVTINGTGTIISSFAINPYEVTPGFIAGALVVVLVVSLLVFLFVLGDKKKEAMSLPELQQVALCRFRSKWTTNPSKSHSKNCTHPS